MSVAESAARVRVRRGGAGVSAEGGGAGDGPREPAEGDFPCCGGASGGAGEGPRLLRGGSGGLPDEDEDGGRVGTGDARAEARPLPLVVPAPTACWMRRSAAAEALWLSFTAPPLTA